MAEALAKVRAVQSPGITASVLFETRERQTQRHGGTQQSEL